MWEKTEARLRAMTRMLVRRHRALIERVAAKLLDETTLGPKALDKLIGRSVNDVKPTPPLVITKAEAALFRKAITRAVSTSGPEKRAMTTRAPFTQQTIRKAIAAARKEGLHIYGIRPDGTVMVGENPPLTDAAQLKQPENATPSVWDDVEA